MVNRHKNNRKRHPTPLTEDIINEMNKHNLSGLDNFGADDLYGMEDVWNDNKGYDKLPKKVGNMYEYFFPSDLNGQVREALSPSLQPCGLLCTSEWTQWTTSLTWNPNHRTLLLRQSMGG